MRANVYDSDRLDQQSEGVLGKRKSFRDNFYVKKSELSVLCFTMLMKYNKQFDKKHK